MHRAPHPEPPSPRRPLLPALVLALALGSAACSRDRARPRRPEPLRLPPSARVGPVCAAFGPPVERGRVRSGKLKEMSGLAASRLHPGVLWTHNDHGKAKARVHAIDTAGRHLASWRLKGVDPRDTEDIALGPCAAAGEGARRPCIYLGDLGDNLHKRAHVQIYRVPEPATLPRPSTATGGPRKGRFRKREVEVLRFRYAPGRGEEPRPDVEALAVLPDARVVVLTKRRDGTATVYRVPPDPAGEAIAEPMGRLDLRVPPGNPVGARPATAADLTDDGRWLLVRTGERMFVFDVGDALLGDAGRSRRALRAARRWEIAAGRDAQGEAACWDRAAGIWHVSESPTRPVDVPLWHLPCARGGGDGSGGPR